jgi:small subunit ribosomal protein S6
MMCIFNPDLDEAGLEAQNDRLRTFIAGRGGEVTAVEPWGRRRLAYSIGGFRDGIYTITRFTMPTEETTALDRSLKLNDAVVRHLIVRPDAD